MAPTAGNKGSAMTWKDDGPLFFTSSFRDTASHGLWEKKVYSCYYGLKGNCHITIMDCYLLTVVNVLTFNLFIENFVTVNKSWISDCNFVRSQNSMSSALPALNISGWMDSTVRVINFSMWQNTNNTCFLTEFMFMSLSYRHSWTCGNLCPELSLPWPLVYFDQSDS